MKLSLSQCGNIEYFPEAEKPASLPDHTILKASHCAVCRTDAKMWRTGHRDLVLPRVLGHEIAGIDEATSQRYTVWPGQACGRCSYCRTGRENLCEQMKIIGFHSDGGFARFVSVPDESLIPVIDSLDPFILTFCEPAACILNGLEQLNPSGTERVIVFGGGVVGMMAALIFSERGCRVTVVEQSQEKLSRLTHFAKLVEVELLKDTRAADFDLAMNCCDSPIAFSLCITKLRKGGKLCFFSGLKKNEELGTNLLNLMHYKEIELYGSYGPRRDHMTKALPILAKNRNSLELLIEKIIAPQELEGVLPHILSGKALKYIVDFSLNTDSDTVPLPRCPNGQKPQASSPSYISPLLAEITRSIYPVSKSFSDSARKKVDMKTKPLGALGRIEDLAVKMAVIQKNLNPTIDTKRIFVFAGDHGVVEEGVSAFPAKVTVQMVDNFLEGGAAINSFCSQYGIDLSVVDMGVNGDFPQHPLLIDKKVARGTDNFAIGPAMSKCQAILAIEHGIQAFLETCGNQPCGLVGMGEMGIGNTSSATAIICAASGLMVEQIIGRGTGVDDKGLQRKCEVLEKALALHQLDSTNALHLLTKIGGYELGGICGAILAAASRGWCVVLDGIISTAAGLLAYLICPHVKDYLVAGHRSVEHGQMAALKIMGLEPVLDLDMRLGEGTGAAITMNLIELSCTMMRQMASFEEAGVDRGAL